MALTVDKLFVLVEAVFLQLNLTVGSLCRTITIGQIIDNQLDDLGLFGHLLKNERFGDV